MARSNEPIAWSLFGAGGVVAALLLPVMILLTGIAVPVGWISQSGLFNLVHSPLTRLYLFVVISLSLFHGAHRIRFVLMDLGLKAIGGLVAAICYAFAIVGTLLAVVFLIQL
jgi:fumarate reductase subunit D